MPPSACTSSGARGEANGLTSVTRREIGHHRRPRSAATCIPRALQSPTALRPRVAERHGGGDGQGIEWLVVVALPFVVVALGLPMALLWRRSILLRGRRRREGWLARLRAAGQGGRAPQTGRMTRATRSTSNSSVATRTAKRMASIKGGGW